MHLKRTHVGAAAAMVLFPAGAAVASAPPGSDATAPAGTATATIYDDDDAAVATVSVGSVEAGWTGYGDDDAPDEGHEYLRMSVLVTSESGDDTFSVSLGDFVLQDGHGVIDGADDVESVEQAASDTDPTTEAELANNESVELVLTFEYRASSGPESVFYRQGDGLLVDIAELGDDATTGEAPAPSPAPAPSAPAAGSTAPDGGGSESVPMATMPSEPASATTGG